MPRLRTWSLVALAASALGLAACGNSTPNNAGSGAATTTTTTAAPTTTTTAGTPTTTAPSSTPTTVGGGLAAIPAADRSPAGTSGKQPTVIVPTSAPPTNMEGADLIVGTGATAKSGDTVTVQYVLATYSYKKVVQSSWTSQPFSFTIGQGQVIAGWDQGVPGMKVGGRRELIIPPSLGYGAQSQGQGIAANDTLVFVIDLLKIG
jgi:peptidylprolyl isomerase